MNFGWRIDPAPWALIPTELSSSRAWRSVGFTEVEADGVPARESGIYMFCAYPVGIRPTHHEAGALFSLLLTPIYVGRTNDLRRRFIEHCRRPSPEVRAARVCFGMSMEFWYHARRSAMTRTDEAVLINCFGPPANKRRETVAGTFGTPRRIGVPTKNPKGR